MNLDTTTSPKEKSSGFTLLEMSIVIIIIGFLVIPLLQLYKTYVIDQEIETTQTNILAAKSAMNLNIGRYPCPADRSLPSTDPNYGKEQCTGIPNCTAFGNEGICRTTGSRDADGDGNPDNIIIGGLPYLIPQPSPYTPKIIPGMLALYMLDGWGNKMTYAVSENLMIDHGARDSDFKLGVISAINEHGNATAGVNDDAQFVIVSHGKDKSGAFDREGTFTACPTGKTESENCDNDSTFVSALGVYEGNSAQYYDDFSYFLMRSPGELWYSLSDSTNSISPHINNLNTANIGINTASPTEKLDVTGDINADTIRADTLCDSSGTNCITPDAISNLGQCPTGQVISKISGGSFSCTNPTLSITTGTATCATGKFITTILTSGCIICNDGVTVCP